MKRKKLISLFAAMAMTVNAQVYLGGSVGVGSVKFGHNDAETTYKFMPEIGYNLNSDWAIGVVLGYQKGACKLGNGNYGQDVDTELLQISPYVRYTVFKSNLINAFVDGYRPNPSAKSRDAVEMLKMGQNEDENVVEEVFSLL